MEHTVNDANAEPEKGTSLMNRDVEHNTHSMPSQPIGAGVLSAGFHSDQSSVLFPLPRPYFPQAAGQSPLGLGSLSNRPNGGWTAHKSENSVYYYNTITHISQWECPFQFQGDVSKLTNRPKPISLKQIANTQWSEVTCEDGRIYYYNSTTKEAAWNLPEINQAKSASLPAPTQSIKTPEWNPLVDRPEAKQGRKATQEEIEKFQELLEESDINAYSRFEKEAIKYEDDPRWNGVTLQRERKQLFNDFCQRAAQREITSKQKASDAFRQLLSELRENEVQKMQNLDPSSGGDGELDVSELFSMESTLDQIESHCQDDPRWQSCSDSTRREIYSKFCESLRLRRKTSDVVEQTYKERKLDERRNHIRESHRRLQRVSHMQALDNFKVLLTEVVKQPGVTWRHIKSKLESDIQGRGTDPNLTEGDCERLFYEHVNELEQTGIVEYEKLLKEKLPSLTPYDMETQATSLEDYQLPYYSFEEAERHMYLDPRIIQPSLDTKRRLWRSHVLELGAVLEDEGVKRTKHELDRGLDEGKRSRRY
eukprot:g7145.t1